MSTTKPANVELKTVTTHEAGDESFKKEGPVFGVIPQKYILPFLFLAWYM